MHFFRTKKNHRGHVVSLVVFALLASGIWVLISHLGQRSDAEQIALLKKALRRASVSCYAVEGRYPSDLAYLEDNYGVTVNKDRYIVKYEAFAENIMPDIVVLEHGKEMDDLYDDDSESTDDEFDASDDV